LLSAQDPEARAVAAERIGVFTGRRVGRYRTLVGVISAQARTASRLSSTRRSCAAELRGEVAGMLGVAVGVHGILGAADELSSVTLDQLRLIEAKLP